MATLTPRIKLIFKGLQLSCIQEGREFAEVGLIRSASDHKLEVTIDVTDGAGFALPPDFDSEQNISIEVENTTLKGIRVFTDPAFNRETGDGDERDFRWFIDLESAEFFNRKVGVKHDELSPIVRINNAEFYTNLRTKINAVKKNGGTTIKLGKIGLEIAADIDLDRPDSKAVLKSGGREILRVEGNQGPQYTIEFDSDCKDRRRASDFTLLYKAIAENLADNEKIDIGPEAPQHAAGHESDFQLVRVFTPTLRCSGANLSKTTGLSTT